MRKSIARLTAACLALSAPAAAVAVSADAAPVAKKAAPGTSFGATTADGGVQLVLTKDRRQVRSTLFAYKYTCTDGDSGFDYDGFKAIRIAADRSFKASYDSGPRPDPGTPGATLTYRSSISGKLNKLGTKIVGTARTTFSYASPAGTSYTCDTGSVAFVAAD